MTRVGPFVGAITAIAITILLALVSPSMAAPAGAATDLAFGHEVCGPDGTVSGRLDWTPSGVGDQYVDLALDGGFGRFSTGGPYAASVSLVSLTRLTAGSTYYVRIRTQVGAQTIASDTLTVVARTCAATPEVPGAISLQLVNRHSGKCLEIYGFSQANLAQADQWTCWGGPNQLIRARPLADGNYELRLAHSGKCLEVLNWNTANGAAIGQYDCHGGDNQRWSAEFENGALTLVRSKFSGKCLDVYAWAVGDGERIVQWDCHGGGNQQWRTVVSGATPPPSTSGPAIAITIDTDTIRGYVPQMLDILDAYGVKASFGVTGQWAANNPDLVRRMAASGHTVMNHSWSHPFFTAISSAARQEEIRRTDEVVQQIAGISTKPYFRPPYGNTNAAIRADAEAVGHRIILWNVDPQGWRGYSAEVITNHILSHAFNGAVVLMHSTSAGDLAALGPAIEGLRSQGYRFVTIAQLYP